MYFPGPDVDVATGAPVAEASATLVAVASGAVVAEASGDPPAIGMSVTVAVEAPVDVVASVDFFAHAVRSSAVHSAAAPARRKETFMRPIIVQTDRQIL